MATTLINIPESCILQKWLSKIVMFYNQSHTSNPVNFLLLYYKYKLNFVQFNINFVQLMANSG